jgi:hypothetical protein
MLASLVVGLLAADTAVAALTTYGGLIAARRLPVCSPSRW